MSRARTWQVVRNDVPAHMDRGETSVEYFQEIFAEELQSRLRYNSPVDSHDLASSWTSKHVSEDMYSVSSDEIQSKILHTGSGVHNKEGSTGPLRPTDAKGDGVLLEAHREANRLEGRCLGTSM